MDVKYDKFSALMVTAAIMLTSFAGTASAGDDNRKRINITGTSTGLFVQLDPLGLSQGRAVNDVAIAGNFTITVRDVIRTGRYTFPHILVANLDFPPGGGPPAFVSGYVSGGSAWFFDDGVVCTGRESGEFDETGFNLVTRAQLECTDGTRLKMKIRNVAVEPGVSVESDIKGKLIVAEKDDD